MSDPEVTVVSSSSPDGSFSPADESDGRRFVGESPPVITSVVVITAAISGAGWVGFNATSVLGAVSGSDAKDAELSKASACTGVVVGCWVAVGSVGDGVGETVGVGVQVGVDVLVGIGVSDG